MKKISLVVDTDDWAFYNKAKLLKDKLSIYYEFKIIPATILENNVLQIILLTKDSDLIHFFWRGLLFDIYEIDVLNKFNIDPYLVIKKLWGSVKKTTCVPDHLFLEDEFIETNIKMFNFIDNYYVSSKKLYDIYYNKFDKKPKKVIIGGVNLELFYPDNLERLNNLNNRNLIIGWTGNSNWGDWNKNTEDTKGVRTILIPAIDELKQEGYNIRLELVDKNTGFIQNEDMKNFYNKIDVYVCTSKTEGTPNPILEAMACGVPIISTDVGIASEVFGEKQKEYILNQRTIKNLKEKLIDIIENPNKLKILSEENLEKIKDSSYDITVNHFKEFFDNCLKG